MSSQTTRSAKSSLEKARAAVARWYSQSVWEPLASTEMPSKRILAVGYEELLWSAQALLSERNTGHQQKFMLDAVIAVITKGEKFLLIQRAPGIRGGGRWAPVSGEVEPGESQEAAVAREAMEEVGLTVRPVRKVWECVSTGGSFLLHWWIAEYVSGELALNPAEASAARWLTVEEICRLDGTFEGDRDFYLKILPSLSS